MIAVVRIHESWQKALPSEMSSLCCDSLRMSPRLIRCNTFLQDETQQNVTRVTSKGMLI